MLRLLVCCSLALLLPATLFVGAQQPDDKKPPARALKVRTLNDTDFFLKVPATRAAWEARRKEVREQVLVATGLWPMPPKTPLRPVIHGKIDRDDYTVEKVFFASLPGHYVSGNLYRPKGKTGKLPAVLCPHGHWNKGRLFDAGEAAAKREIASKAEETMAGARYPLQARCAQLARMGCVVFFYDMVGYADSKRLGHVALNGADAELHLQTLMGLQTWNSVRALDFLLSLPEVDAKRIGVTGASGGGTQTFILCGIDDRPAAAFPAVMVSTKMQGGCVCENCSYLRLGTGNVELAGLFAPKPLAMSGANDWTLEIESKGLPELKKLYKLYDAEDKVHAKCYPKFGHNYNQVSRELMYDWFNKHLALGHSSPVKEKPFEPIAPDDLKVYTKDHPLPKDAVDADRLRQYLTATSEKQIAALKPSDAKSLGEYRRVLGTALRVMIHDKLPAKAEVTGKTVEGPVAFRFGRSSVPGRRTKVLIQRQGGTGVPALVVSRPKGSGTVVVWAHPKGQASLFEDSKPIPAAEAILVTNATIVAPDVFGAGQQALEKPFPVNASYAGYTFGYNRPVLSQRVSDILTTVAYAASQPGVRNVHLIGFEEAGPWVMLARGLCGDAVTRTAADVNRFRFEKVRTTRDEMMLPGALKYGGLAALTAVAAPGELFVHNNRGTGMGGWLKPAYKAAGAEKKVRTSGEKVEAEKVVEWLLR
jgi:dienelactone hydrolase